MIEEAPSKARATPQLYVKTQIEELAIKQSKQLIPVTPAITKASTLSLFDKANPKTAVRSNEMNLTPKAIQQKPSSPPPVNANNQFVDVGVLMTNPPNMNLLVLKPVSCSVGWQDIIISLEFVKFHQPLYCPFDPGIDKKINGVGYGIGCVGNLGNNDCLKSYQSSDKHESLSENNQEGFAHISQSVEELVVQVKDTVGRVEEEIELLERSSGGRKKKNARAQGEKDFNTLEEERSRKLGNMACEYLHLDKYEISKRYYGRVVFLEPNRNKPCNFAICLMKMSQFMEEKAWLRNMKGSCGNRPMHEAYAKSYERALLMLGELRTRNYNNESDTGRAFLVPTDLESNFDSRKVPAEDYMVKSNPPPKKSWLDMVEEDEEEFKDEHFDYNEFAWSFMHPVDVKGLNLDDYYEIIESIKKHMMETTIAPPVEC
ncbi:hypothetical protein ACFE04_005797 [Oxalis oulophora]